MKESKKQENDPEYKYEDVSDSIDSDSIDSVLIDSRSGSMDCNATSEDEKKQLLKPNAKPSEVNQIMGSPSASYSEDDEKRSEEEEEKGNHGFPKDFEEENILCNFNYYYINNEYKS